jgi:ATP:corrinoid adenosyltransferase
MYNLFSLPHLLARKTKGKAPLIDYSQSHVVTLDEYLDILRMKIIPKENVEEIKESKREEREKKQNRRIIDEGITID